LAGSQDGFDHPTPVQVTAVGRAEVAELVVAAFPQKFGVVTRDQAVGKTDFVIQVASDSDPLIAKREDCAMIRTGYNTQYRHCGAP
jgi:hypothetical protein